MKRAIESVRAQTFSAWQLRVVNDDPDDRRVEELVDSISDPRIKLFVPIKKRGAAGSFNEAFRAENCEFSSLLEDDNWWEPNFLEVMLGKLSESPKIGIACANERVWKEMPDGSWIDTGAMVLKGAEDEVFTPEPAFACGSAKLCNSALLIRRAGFDSWVTPEDIPPDVTEHFRDRVINSPILLVKDHLVNFSVTQDTARNKGGTVWSDYQTLLTGTVFASIKEDRRMDLAKNIFRDLGGGPTPRASALLLAASAVPQARSLWLQASWRQWFCFLRWAFFHPHVVGSALMARKSYSEHWEFLMGSYLNERFGKRFR